MFHEAIVINAQAVQLSLGDCCQCGKYSGLVSKEFAHFHRKQVLWNQGSVFLFEKDIFETIIQTFIYYTNISHYINGEIMEIYPSYLHL